MKIYKLSKLALVIKQKDSKLMNDITSNPLDKTKNTILDRYGKIIVSFDQIIINADELLIVIQDNLYERLMKFFNLYLKLSKASIEKTDYNVYFDLNSDYKVDKHELLISQVKGQLVITKKELENSITAKEFTLFRLKNNIPMQGIDYDQEMVLNVSEELASDSKGCYPGQEIVARINTYGQPPKKLTVRYEDQIKDRKTMTSLAEDDTGKKLGFVFVKTKILNTSNE